jgi:predicted TIM-barrel fold metal-dependent hydrolase
MREWHSQNQSRHPIRRGEKTQYFIPFFAVGDNSTYVRSGRVYFHAEDYEPLLGATSSYLSPEVLYYASDWPHWDTEFPENITQLSQRQDLSPADKRWLLSDTAKKLYKLTE